MRLPWVGEDLFVGRQIPDISEAPTHVRRLSVKTYLAALAGERGRFRFTSFGHSFVVDAVPAQGEHGHVEAVLAIATPARAFGSAARAYERTAELQDRAATSAEQRAERHRRAGRSDLELAERKQARRARQSAERARTNALRLRSRDAALPIDSPALTAREAEVLSLASHGFTAFEIAEQLGVSVNTVKTHFENIYQKLGASDKAAAVAAALRHGLIE
jgi:DNA-binding CsgD family transcriptional regulator